MSKKQLLLEAIENNDVSKVIDLIAAGADVNWPDENKQTPLHKAALTGKEQISLKLIMLGADINAKDNNGRTPLFLAASNGYEQ